MYSRKLDQLLDLLELAIEEMRENPEFRPNDIETVGRAYNILIWLKRDK